MGKKKSTGRPSLRPEYVRRVLRALAALVKEHGTAAAAARACGLTQSAVSQLLSEKNKPSLATAERVAAARGVDVFALLSGAAQ